MSVSLLTRGVMVGTGPSSGAARLTREVMRGILSKIHPVRYSGLRALSS